MSQPVITVEGLGKRYLIGHQVRHDTLRDRIAYGARGLLRRWKHSVGGTTTQEEFWALRDVSFEIKQGEVVGIIGRNGAGKSTLLKILSRITEPTTGRASIRGRVASLLEVGTGFHPELTGRENVYLNGAILGMTRTETRRKFDEIVAFAEVERFLDTPVKHYSSGMYVRLAFAVAAHLEPEILIVDEVLAVGDTAFQQKCLGKMQTIANGEGRTVLFVSHNMIAVQRLCRSVLLMERGRSHFLGPVDKAIESYLNLDSADAILDADQSLILADRPQNGNGTVHFRRLRLLDDQGRPVASSTIGQSLTIEVEFEVLDYSPALVVGIGVHDSLGEALFATHWNDQGQTHDLVAGIWRTSCRFDPNYLRVGTYPISLGAESKRGLCGHLPDAFRLRIEPVMNRPQHNYDERIGRLLIPMRWSDPSRLQST